MLVERADQAGAAVALACPDEHVEATYAELASRARAFSEVLESNGVNPGDRVAIMMGNGLAYVTCLLGVWRQGAVVVPVDPMLKGPDARDLITASGANALAIDRKRLVEMHGLRRECTALRATFITDSETVEEGCLSLDASLAAVAKSQSPHLQNVDADAVAIESYRAHTDGFELVRRTHAGLLADADALVSEIALVEADRGICAIQLGHRDAVSALVASLASGGRCVVFERFDARRFWELVAAQRATWLALVPTQFYDIQFGGPPASGAHELVHAAFVAGSSVPVQAREDFAQRFGIQVRAMRQA